MNDNGYTRLSCLTRCSKARFVSTLVLVLALAPTTYALKDDADQPIHIEGDDAEIDQVNRTVVYEGNVQVDQGTLRVNANKLVIEYENRKVVRITAHGTPARYSQQLEGEQGLVEAHAQTIVYHTEDDLVDLKGDASLTQQGSELTGELITYDIVLGKVEASAGGNGRVQTIFQPAGGP